MTPWTPAPAHPRAHEPAAAARCHHVGQSGWQCGNLADAGTSTCAMHREGAPPRLALAPRQSRVCGVPNRTYRGAAGLACPNRVEPGTDRCWRHMGVLKPKCDLPVAASRVDLGQLKRPEQPRCFYARRDGSLCLVMVRALGQRCRVHCGVEGV